MSDFDEDYFLRGKDTGVSNYEDYRWLPEQTLAYACSLAGVLGMTPRDTCLDYGCARGYLVKALRMMGVKAEGYDISDWAIQNADPDVAGLVSTHFPMKSFDYVISKDTLEHIEEEALRFVLPRLFHLSIRGGLVIVPLTREDGGEYFRDEDESDRTHKIRWTFGTWMGNLGCLLPNWNVWGSLHIEGIKRASGESPGSTGFFKIER